MPFSFSPKKPVFKTKFLPSVFYALILINSATVAATETQTLPEKSPEQLPEKIEQLKEEVLELNRDLFILQEDLLFPANTQFSIYISMESGKYFDLDSVKLTINDKMVTSHLYTEKQKAALLRGGIQKLHLGNLKSGEHNLVAVFTGEGPENREYTRAVEKTFKKTSDPLHFEIQILDQEKSQQPEFKIKTWQE